MTTARFPRLVPHKYLLHAPTLLPLAPWVVVLAALGSTPRFDPVLFGVWALIHAATLAIAAAVGLGFSAFLQRLGKTLLGLGWVLTTGALIGAVKAVGTYSVEAAFLGTTAPIEALIARGTGGVLVGMWLVTLVAFGKTAVASVAEATEALIRQNVAHRLAEESDVTSPEVTRSLQAVSELRDTLQATPDAVSAEDVRDVVDSTIRPLSRAMWSVENRRYPEPRLLSLYRLALRSLKIRALLISTVWAATSFTAIVVAVGVIPAAVYSVLGGAIAFVVFSLVRLGWTTSVAVSLVVVLFASVGTVTMAHLALVSIFEMRSDALSLLVLIASAVWMVFVVLGSSAISGVLELQKLIQHDLASNTTQLLISQRSQEDATYASTKRLATTLHGTVQSTLLGLANALEHKDISPEEARSRLSEISDQLTELTLGSDTTSHPLPTVDAINQLMSSWRGLIEVVVDHSSRAILEEVCQRSGEANDILREAITNAHRHGKAQTVHISAETHPSGDVTLGVTDDGYGPRRGQPGLGSTLLDAWTQHRWSLRPGHDGGSVLVATLTLDPSVASDSQ